ncbi:MAG TPA: Holliday junction resolvase RuvX [Micromonosporaceae bacterium]
MSRRSKSHRDEPGPWFAGVRLGVDVGTVRVGVAVCDPDGILATPLVTLRRDANTDREHVPDDIAQLMRLVATHESVEVVVGLPVTLAGTEGPAAAHARAYAQRLAQAIAPVPVRLADERMSTVTATRRLSERGVRGGRRRAVVDQAAAVEILQGWLDAARRRGDA